ncbi:O-antigen ligase family protein [Robbsia sp. Bb-Pol-6]|uniref:O-antigen ligase family protein n=1 Tax=Robbsia betulipollinis TaxID=2981849 RepID=A0ABT3ZTC2_9BURK|nr:O-antigen ligase family protein [Robbsia betulipollinis]MCY0389783.1 O-antigen ligase family protein [Robbsia betulipollinis]
MTPQITHFSVDARKPDAKGFWWPIIGLVVVTFLLLLAHQSSLLQLAYPAMTFVIAIYFYIKYPVQFIGYIWWIFFWTPEVRRFSDFVQGGFTEVSLIMTAPLLVSAPLAFTMLRRIRYLGTRPGLPMLLILVALAYGYIVGILNVGFAAATFGLSSWVTPVMVGFYLAVSWRQYPEYRRCVMRTFTIGIAACAGYAIIQYVFMPPWDALWLIGSGMTSSMGQPLPFAVRAFGPLNSVGPFATIILAGVLSATVAEGNRGRVFTALLGIVALGLSFVRSAWGALIVAMLYQMLFFDNKTRIRVVIGALIVVAATIPVFMSSNISENFQKRVDTLTDLQNDTSFSERSSFYQTFLDTALTNVAGAGLGATGTGGKLSDDANAQDHVNFDSGLMEIPFVLGWPGTLLYVFGISWLMIRGAMSAIRQRSDRFVIAWFSIAIAIISELIFFNQLISSPGQLALMGMVLPIMALRYTKYQNSILEKNRIDNSQVLP